MSPVVGQGQTSKRIYLPAGKWIDWFTGRTYAGGQTIEIPVDAKTWRDIPLFIRDGAIIPMQPVMDYVGQHPVTTVTVQVFPSDNATHFDYYDDDGETYAYEKGAFFLQRLSTQRDGDNVTFRTQAPSGTYRPVLRHWLVKVHGITAATVRAKDVALEHYPTPAVLESATGEGWATGHDRYGAFTVLKLGAGAARDVTLH